MKKESNATNHNPRTEHVMPPGEEIDRKPLKDSVFEEMAFTNILYAILQLVVNYFNSVTKINLFRAFLL